MFLASCMAEEPRCRLRIRPCKSIRHDTRSPHSFRHDTAPKHPPGSFRFRRCRRVFPSVRCRREGVFPGAHERTPALSEYASWINNTNEGPTEEQVLVNLDFFKWLHDEYGMVLLCPIAGPPPTTVPRPSPAIWCRISSA